MWLEEKGASIHGTRIPRDEASVDGDIRVSLGDAGVDVTDPAVRWIFSLFGVDSQKHTTRASAASYANLLYR